MSSNYKMHYEVYHPSSDLSHRIKMVKYYKRILCNLLPKDKNINILEIGSGFGFCLQALDELGYKNVTGLDISPEMAEVSLNFGYSTTIVSDTLAYLEKKSGNQFDIILLFDVLEHFKVEQIEPIIKQMFEKIVEGGRLIIQTPNANFIFASRMRYIDFTHTIMFTENTIDYLFKNAGFSSIHYLNEQKKRPNILGLYSKKNRIILKEFIARKIIKFLFFNEMPWENKSRIIFDNNLFFEVVK
jgi:2-polyprenyl-3-methyl-5-hydroxy-6-metoxy-1,4-benzoquinol methylase